MIDLAEWIVFAAIFISFKDSGTIVVMALTVIVLCFIIYYFNAHIRNKQDHDDK